MVAMRTGLACALGAAVASAAGLGDELALLQREPSPAVAELHAEASAPSMSSFRAEQEKLVEAAKASGAPIVVASPGDLIKALGGFGGLFPGAGGGSQGGLADIVGGIASVMGPLVANGGSPEDIMGNLVKGMASQMGSGDAAGQPAALKGIMDGLAQVVPKAEGGDAAKPANGLQGIMDGIGKLMPKSADGSKPANGLQGMMEGLSKVMPKAADGAKPAGGLDGILAGIGKLMPKAGGAQGDSNDKGAKAAKAVADVVGGLLKAAAGKPGGGEHASDSKPAMPDLSQLFKGWGKKKAAADKP